MAAKTYEDLEVEMINMQIKAAQVAAEGLKEFTDKLRKDGLLQNRIGSEAGNLLTRVLSTADNHLAEVSTLIDRLQNSTKIHEEPGLPAR